MSLGYKVIATLGLHLGLSANLRIWQVSACKLEPRSGMIMHVMTTHHPHTHSGASILPHSGFILDSQLSWESGKFKLAS